MVDILFILAKLEYLLSHALISLKNLSQISKIFKKYKYISITYTYISLHGIWGMQKLPSVRYIHMYLRVLVLRTWLYVRGNTCQIDARN